MNFTDLLRGKGIEPQRVLVLRHRPLEPELRKVLPWLAAEKPEVFNAYQQTQTTQVEQEMARAGYVAAFIGHEPGKALFVGNCAFCHGGAKAKISPMRDNFSPPVPQLINRIPHDDDAWLFWVTKHGVRMTGMPAWDGILSDDEMWKVIAFIKHSDQLPPEVQASWQKMASTPGEIEEHVPEQLERAPAGRSEKR